VLKKDVTAQELNWNLFSLIVVEIYFAIRKLAYYIWVDEN
jgi:hypothetical protein